MTARNDEPVAASMHENQHIGTQWQTKRCEKTGEWVRRGSTQAYYGGRGLRKETTEGVDIVAVTRDRERVVTSEEEGVSIDQASTEERCLVEERMWRSDARWPTLGFSAMLVGRSLACRQAGSREDDSGCGGHWWPGEVRW